jgi:hypothetical protein
MRALVLLGFLLASVPRLDLGERPEPTYPFVCSYYGSPRLWEVTTSGKIEQVALANMPGLAVCEGGGLRSEAILLSPDDRYLACVDSALGLAVLALESKTIVRAQAMHDPLDPPNGCPIRLLGWSPDSRKILYMGHPDWKTAGQFGIVALDSAADSTEFITTVGWCDSLIRQVRPESLSTRSPSGRRVARIRRSSGRSEMVVDDNMLFRVRSIGSYRWLDDSALALSAALDDSTIAGCRGLVLLVIDARTGAVRGCAEVPPRRS